MDIHSTEEKGFVCQCSSRTASYTIVSVAIKCAAVVMNRAGRVTSSTLPIVCFVFSDAGFLLRFFQSSRT